MCCGRPGVSTMNNSQHVKASVGVALSQTHTTAAPARSPLALPTPVFEYRGETALTIVSPVTRKTYRFDKPGARVPVDVRDRSWVAFVPNLVPAS